jgi:hypothetical protein
MGRPPGQRRLVFSLSLSVAAAGLWAAAGVGWAQTPPGQPVASGLAARTDIAISISRRGAVSPEDGVIRGVELQGEAVNEEMAREFGFRSMRQTVDIDCSSRRDRVAEMEVFDSHALRGRSTARRPSGQWAAPSLDAYLADVISAVCRPGGASGRDVTRQAAAAPDPPPEPRPARMAALTPPKPADVPAPAPKPAQPGPVQTAAVSPEPRQTRIASAPAPAPPPAAAAPRPAAPASA